MIKPFGILNKKDPKALLEKILPSFKRFFKNFRLIEKPKNIQLAGIKTGYVKFYYNLKNKSGVNFATCSELWIVPRKTYFFMIGSGTRKDEKSGTRKEVHEIVNNIKFE